MATTVQHDACELLDADHIATKHLFVEYARLGFAGAATEAKAGGRTKGRTPDGRAALACKICSELTVHAQIKEEIFYPALREVIDVPELLDEAQAEHQRVKALVARIEGLSEADAAMDDLVSQLARAVENHVKEERDLLFPKARAAQGLDLEEVGARMKERQQELESQAP